MPNETFEIVETEEDKINQAFEVIRLAIAHRSHFTNQQKDIAIQVTLDALPPGERPWFLEICQMNKIPMWQVLWGQYRRCNEWGVAATPILDPGWEGKLDWDVALDERACKECGTLFKPENPAQNFCSNACGVAEEKRNILARNAAQEAERDLAREKAKRLGLSLPDDAPPISVQPRDLNNQTSVPLFSQVLAGKTKNEDPVYLETVEVPDA